MINEVHLALDEYSDFGMTKSKSSRDNSRSTYRLYGELMNEIDNFKRDSSDVDDPQTCRYMIWKVPKKLTH